MPEFVIDKSKGVGYFNSLQEDFNTPNLVTYDNEIWGNMNPFFAESGREREEIKEKDRRIREILGIKRSLVLTTPPENTFLEINNNVLKSLSFNNKESAISLRANALVVSEELEDNWGVVVAPKDCAVVVMKSKDTDVMVVLHIGAPQIMQGLHKQVISYLQTVTKDLSRYYVYIFPHIKAENYKLSDEKRKILDPSLNKYLDQETCFDFIRAFKAYLVEIGGISNFIDSGIDSYAASKNGNMYSHTFEKELKEKGLSFNKGAHNVVIKI